jgi:surfeit locus 1 family protein
MAWRRILVTLLVAGTVFTCVRLGLWQLARASEKRLAAAARATLLAEPPVDLADSRAAASVVPGRRVRVTGAWDRERHILLSGRTHLGAAGVIVVSPAILADGARVLVERGWLAAADARTAHPEAWPDSVADVIGVAQPLPAAAQAVPWAKLAATRGDVELWSARTLDSAQVARHVPAPYVPWSVAVLRAGGASPPHGLVAVGEPPGEAGERVHVSYAIQWFAFALIALVGSIALMVRGAREPAARG